MRCGLPVVSTDAEWGPREILTDGVDGLLTPVGDAGALSDALLRLIRDEPRRRAMAEAALASSARYDPDAIAARYEQLFDELAARKKKRRQRYAEAPPVLGPAPTMTQPVVDCEVTPAGDVLLRPGPCVPSGTRLTWRGMGKDQGIEVPQVGLTVRLGDLADGAWELLLPGGESAVAGVRETRSLLEMPAEGGVHRQLPYRMVTGALGLRVWRRPVHAEVGEVRADGAGVHVRGRLVGAAFAGAGATPPVLLLAGPENARREVPAEVLSPAEFRATVPALPAGTWHLSIVLDDGARTVRLGRFLDDVADKKSAYVLPAATINGTLVQPVYLWGNEFSVRVTD
jgi:Glycosyl transferases group 1